VRDISAIGDRVEQCDYDPLDEAFLAEPYATYRALRDHDPVHRHDDPPFYALSRFEDVWTAVRDPGLYSSAQGLTFHPDEIDALGLAPTIVMLDPPRQTELRRLISHGFTPRRVAALEHDLREFVRQRITAMETKAAEGLPIDLHRDFSAPIPTYVLAELLGVPAADRARFDPWVKALTTLQDDGFDTASVMNAPDAVAEMFAYFGDVIAARRQEPTDDLVSALVTAEVDGERLTDWDVLGFCFVMVAGGNDTTANLISHGVMLLDDDHVQRDLLRSDLSLVPGAVMEFLRLEGSVQGLARTTTAPVVVHDVEIPEGSKVLLMYASANRDEREFGPTADRLDITRDMPRHLGFASGPHFCIGNHLAKLQARVALEELLTRQPGIGVDVARGERVRAAFTRGWVSLPATGVTPQR
jgi:cytochrome P450 family 130